MGEIGMVQFFKRLIQFQFLRHADYSRAWISLSAIRRIAGISACIVCIAMSSGVFASNLGRVQTVGSTKTSLFDIPLRRGGEIHNIQQTQGESQNSSEELAELFEKLSLAPNQEISESIAKDIQELWLESDSDTITLLMSRSAKAINNREYSLALDFLDAVVRFKPNYAEGWNRRATVLYLLEDFEMSIKDIEQTLALEPRHWGALSGLALIMRRLDQQEDALKIYEQILSIYPHLESAKTAMEELEIEIHGKKL